jgi:hypothetical protein
MPSINFFVEDSAHERFLNALVQRFANQYGVHVEIEYGTVTGGHGRVITELKRYIRDLHRSRKGVPDLLIVATDGNCKGYLGRKQEVDEATKDFKGSVICAIPDPHIERWLLLDSAAFKKVLGKGCAAPTQKCERGLYKRLLLQAVRNTGAKPRLRGIEYAEALVNAMDLETLERKEPSLGKLLKALRHQFQEWEQAGHTSQTSQIQPPATENPQT